MVMAECLFVRLQQDQHPISAARPVCLEKELTLHLRRVPMEQK